MYNRVLRGLYREFKTQKRESGVINFLNHDGNIVAVLYPSTMVLNIFLSASSDVIWNHYDTAIFVLAPNYSLMTDKYIQHVEAAWLIGLCGAAHENDLTHPMFLGSAEGISMTNYSQLLGYATLSKVLDTNKKNEVKFSLLDYEVTYCFEPQPYSHIEYLNPAVIRVLNSKLERDDKRLAARYLRNKYDWEYTVGFNTRGSAETREFISKVAPRHNHTKLSKIRYSRTTTS